MFSKIKKLFFKPRGVNTEIPPAISVQQDTGFSRANFTTEEDSFRVPREILVQNFMQRTFQRNVQQDTVYPVNVAMDEDIQQLKQVASGAFSQMPWPQFEWYGAQSFIGHQMCAILAQHWMILKACHMPAEDAVRNGYSITSNDGEELDAAVLNAIVELDTEYRIDAQLEEFLTRGRIFGIRIAMFKVDYADPQAYEKPFNIDGVTAKSYKGIVQIDPYWITPELDAESSSDPASMYFYEPTWWRINGKRYHRTHLIIMRHAEVADILKPTYYYGGVSLPQQIYERVYSAERTANEAPLLAMTKRTNVMHVDLSQFVANPQRAQATMEKFAWYRDNYGVKLAGLEEEFEQFDTSLADLDDVIMSQFQIVAAISGVPATKILGTSPKGFNATGEFEEASYHELLKTLQKHFLTPFLKRHHELLMRSEIAPQFNGKIFNIEATWKPVDSMTAKELAEINKMKAETDSTLANVGAIDGQDIRKRIINDQESGYNGIEDLTVNSELDDPNISSEQLEDSDKGEIYLEAQGSTERL